MTTFLFDLFFTLVTFESHVYKHEIERLGVTLPEWERAVMESGAYLGHITEPMALMREFIRCTGKTVSEEYLQKPGPAIYLLAAGRMGARPEDCVFVGDGGSDELAGAKAAGMRTAQARWFLRRDVEGADCKLERFEDILRME